jgi:hypothetical protein
MFAGAGLGLFIGLSASHFADAISHQGFGIEVLRDSDSGFFLILVGMGIWFFVADYAKGINKLEKEKNELEKSWVRIILNPDNVQEIRRHPQYYREDFKQWTWKFNRICFYRRRAKPNINRPNRNEHATKSCRRVNKPARYDWRSLGAGGSIRISSTRNFQIGQRTR